MSNTPQSPEITPSSWDSTFGHRQRQDQIDAQGINARKLKEEARIQAEYANMYSATKELFELFLKTDVQQARIQNQFGTLINGAATDWLPCNNHSGTEIRLFGHLKDYFESSTLRPSGKTVQHGQIIARSSDNPDSARSIALWETTMLDGGELHGLPYILRHGSTNEPTGLKRSITLMDGAFPDTLSHHESISLVYALISDANKSLPE